VTQRAASWRMGAVAGMAANMQIGYLHFRLC